MNAATRHLMKLVNLSADPAAEIHVGGVTIAVLAHEADRQERARLWPMVKRFNPFYAMYEELGRARSRCWFCVRALGRRGRL